MAEMNMITAINHALDLAMAQDERVVVFGEDVGVMGGAFGATAGLQAEHGEKRCFDTPLAESAIVGTAVGMALNGLRPVAEIQHPGFIFPALDQIVSHAARMRSRTRGRRSLPMVIRLPHGGGIRAVELHSESLETFLGHIPGLKVVVPSSPYDAKGLLLAAIRDDDPVVFLEPTKLYRAFNQEVPDGDYSVPIGRAKVVRPGTDLTVVSWGAYLHEVLKAAEILHEEGIGAEVIDLRTINPLDRETILASVKKDRQVRSGPRGSQILRPRCRAGCSGGRRCLPLLKGTSHAPYRSRYHYPAGPGRTSLLPGRPPHSRGPAPRRYSKRHWRNSSRLMRAKYSSKSTRARTSATALSLN
jgi:pyruvate dehydrogenase E1 component beta subunit